MISRQPAFTRTQHKALTAGEEFQVINWPAIFSDTPTPLPEAQRITYQDLRCSEIEMPFSSLPRKPLIDLCCVC